MVACGRDVAELLRGNAPTVRQANIQAGTVKANQTLENVFFSDGYGCFYSRNTASDYQRVTDTGLKWRSIQ
jgi:ethanolamine utilization protein EutA (predicted chaperonin)